MLLFSTECIFVIEFEKKKIKEEIPFTVINDIISDEKDFTILIKFEVEYNKVNKFNRRRMS
jgi:hypothetical protein